MPTFSGTVLDSIEFFAGSREPVVELHYATTPIEADLIRSDSGVFTTIAVSVLSPTRIRVTFPQPAKNNSALVQPGNYVITPTLGVYVVTPEVAVDPTYVDLDIDEQTTGVVYELEVQGVEKA